MIDDRTAVEEGPAVVSAGRSLLVSVPVVVALVLPVWWAFSFRAMALASRFDPDCPATGCYSQMGTVVAPIAATMWLVLGLVLLGVFLYRRRLYHITQLLRVLLGQWSTVFFFTIFSLVD